MLYSSLVLITKWPKLIPFWGETAITYYLRKVFHDLFGVVDHCDDYIIVFDECTGYVHVHLVALENGNFMSKMWELICHAKQVGSDKLQAHVSTTYLLFAYQEVLQSSTRFSPFELLYGWPVRGPLDVLREEWESSKRSSESVVSYVLLVRERLSKDDRACPEKLEQGTATAEEVVWQQCSFNPGDQVLVLLPSSTNKLWVQCQGPCEIKRRIGKVDYEVDMFDKKKKEEQGHAERVGFSSGQYQLLCREWSRRVWGGWHCAATWGEGSAISALGIISMTVGWGSCRTYSTIYSDVIQSKPGRTHLAEDNVETGAARPVK